MRGLRAGTHELNEHASGWPNDPSLRVWNLPGGDPGSLFRAGADVRYLTNRPRVYCTATPHSAGGNKMQGRYLANL